MKREKKLLISIVSLIILVVVLICAYMINITGSTKKKYDLDVKPDGYYVENNMQNRADIWIGEYNGHLYFYKHSNNILFTDRYANCLCVIENNGIRKILHLNKGNHIYIVGSLPGYLYYWNNQRMTDNGALYCFDISDEKEILLFSGKGSGKNTAYFTDNTAYIPLYNDIDSGQDTQYLQIQGGQILGINLLDQSFRINGQQYRLTAGITAEEVSIVNKGEKNDLSLGLASRRSIVPVKNGLAIHNQGYQDLLYLISEDNSIRELYKTECMSSRSSMTVINNSIYLSFKRYEKFGKGNILLQRYENDQIEGTYRISLDDLSVEKISDRIFSGMFHFDQTTIWACDELKNIYQLDLDGNIEQVIEIR